MLEAAHPGPSARTAAAAGGAAARRSPVLAVLLAAAFAAGCPAPCGPGDVCAIVGTGALGWSGEGLPADESALASPTSVATDPDGRVVVVDFSNMRVRRLEDDGTVRTILGNGEHGFSVEGALPLDTPLENPEDAVWGPDGLLYVANRHEGRIVRIGANGRVERVAGTGELGDDGDGRPALFARMWDVVGIAFDDDGALYVSDTTSCRVRRVGVDGVIETVLGTGARGAGVAGPGPTVAVDAPLRLAHDAEGRRLLVADAGNHRILAVSLPGLDVTVVGGTGERGHGGDGGPAVDALFDQPADVLPLPDGAFLVADLGNDALRLVDSDGVVTTVAGLGAPGDTLLPAAPPLAMPIRRPAGLAATPDGDILIAERGGHRVLRWVGGLDALAP